MAFGVAHAVALALAVALWFRWSAKRECGARGREVDRGTASVFVATLGVGLACWYFLDAPPPAQAGGGREGVEWWHPRSGG